MILKGSFTVDMKPLPPYAAPSDGAALGRMSLDKEFTGDLEARSQGEMLTGMSPVEGSAGYVALEKVTGTVKGRRGSFLLQHFGIMEGEASKLILEVVPNSGSEDLSGISGKMEIVREGGAHQYVFTAILPD